MSQELANRLKEKYKEITGIDCEAKFMEKGDSHKPSTLEEGYQGVYVLLIDESCCFKVGQTINDKRWEIEHYQTSDNKASRLANHIYSNRDALKTYCFNKCSSTSKCSKNIDSICKKNIDTWIKNNLSRIEFKIPIKKGAFEIVDKTELNLLEALIQFELKPIFERDSRGVEFYTKMNDLGKSLNGKETRNP